jgi:hypothetical protein
LVFLLLVSVTASASVNSARTTSSSEFTDADLLYLFER